MYIYPGEKTGSIKLYREMHKLLRFWESLAAVIVFGCGRMSGGVIHGRH